VQHLAQKTTDYYLLKIYLKQVNDTENLFTNKIATYSVLLSNPE
jgi:hypothetical protein